VRKCNETQKNERETPGFIFSELCSPNFPKNPDHLKAEPRGLQDLECHAAAPVVYEAISFYQHTDARY